MNLKSPLFFVLLALSSSAWAAPVKPTKPAPKIPAIKPPARATTPHSHDHNSNSAAPKDPIHDSVDFLWKQSDEAFHKGDYPTAVKIHRAIVTLDPSDTESFGVASWLLWSMGQKAEARAFLRQGLDANPKSAEMWDAAGQHYNLERAFLDARDAFQKAVSLSGPKAPELLRRRLAHAAEHAGDLSLSIQTWTELARDFPTQAVNRNNLARVQALKGKIINSTTT